MAAICLNQINIMRTNSKFIVALALGLSVCNYNGFAQKDDGSRVIIVTQQEKDFVEEVVEENTYEMHMLQLGMSEGTDAELKEHARHMLADHEKMDTDMRAYARKYNIKLTGVTPNTKKINEKAGAEWDADWADEIADMHRKMVRDFEKAQGLASEPELRNMIIAAIPTLKSHLEMANSLRTRLKAAAKK